jgi:hypothetical protein
MLRTDPDVGPIEKPRFGLGFQDPYYRTQGYLNLDGDFIGDRKTDVMMVQNSWSVYILTIKQ